MLHQHSDDDVHEDELGNQDEYHEEAWCQDGIHAAICLAVIWRVAVVSKRVLDICIRKLKMRTKAQRGLIDSAIVEQPSLFHSSCHPLQYETASEKPCQSSWNVRVHRGRHMDDPRNILEQRRIDTKGSCGEDKNGISPSFPNSSTPRAAKMKNRRKNRDPRFPTLNISIIQFFFHSSGNNSSTTAALRYI